MGQVGALGSEMRMFCLPLSFNITEIERRKEKMGNIRREREREEIAQVQTGRDAQAR